MIHGVLFHDQNFIEKLTKKAAGLHKENVLKFAVSSPKRRIQEGEDLKGLNYLSHTDQRTQE